VGDDGAVTVQWSADLESGNYGQFASTTVTGTGATLQANATAAYAGSYGSDAHVNGASGDEARASSSAISVATSVISAQCRFKAHLMNVGSGQVYLLQLGPTSGQGAAIVEIESGPVYKLLYVTRNISTKSITLTTQFVLDTWYLLELQADWSNSSQETYRVWINGVLDTTDTDATAGSNFVLTTMKSGEYVANATAGAIETYTDNYRIGDATLGVPVVLAAGLPASALGVIRNPLAPEVPYAV
jgi:hypothetical protein